MKVIILVILLFIGCVFGAEKKLDAKLLTEQPIFTNNCGKESKPTEIELKFQIYNPLSVTMKITYEWYDFPSDSYKSHSTYCNIQPNHYGQCSVKIPIALGGKGNGTIDRELIRLTGYDPDVPFHKYKSSFKVKLTHSSILAEENAIGKIRKGEEEINLLRSLFAMNCYKDLCCGRRDAKERMELIKEKLANATNALSFCNISDAYQLASDVINEAPIIRDNIKDCRFPDGAPCSTPQQCEGGYCINGMCSSTPPPTGPICGNGICERGETPLSCPKDCETTIITKNETNQTPIEPEKNETEVEQPESKVCGIFTPLLALFGLILLKK